MATDAGPIYLAGVTGGSVSGNAASGFTGGSQIAGSNNGGSSGDPLLISNNEFSGGFKGINIWGNSSYIDITGNTFSNMSAYGVGIKGQNLQITGNTFSSNLQAAIGLDTHVLATTGVTVSGNTYNSTTTAVEVKNTGSHNISGVTVTETIRGATDAAVKVIGKSGFTTAVDVTGSTLTGNAKAVWVQADASATLTSTNFNGATDNAIDLQIDPAAGTVTMAAGNQFAGDNYFVDNRSSQSLDLTSYTSTNFEGLNPATLTDNFRIEDKMYHKVDAPTTSGLIRWGAGNLYVSAPGTGLNDETIQGGIAAAADTDTLNVENGSYAEGLDTAAAGKDLKLSGRQQSRPGDAQRRLQPGRRRHAPGRPGRRDGRQRL